MTARYVVGIDPGITGALALLGPEGVEAVADMPIMASGKTGRDKVNPAGVAALLRTWTTNGRAASVACELVNAMPSIPDPKTGERRQLGAASGFSLGRSLGSIEGAVAGVGLPLELIPPGVWKRYFGLGKDKEQSRAEALRLYPDVAQELARKKDAGRAEAILIARYAMRAVPARPF